ncbi:MAG TPA: hypothetical protein VMJ10_34890 [Kofleriaceae bacterium]|nr:hypothetical protein [Kofleriaceae bacterium]
MARGVLFHTCMRCWLILVLATVTSVARAQSAPDTDRAIAASVASDQRVQMLAAQRAKLDGRYQAELAAVEQLKKEKPSWRRDRELRQNLADASDTAGQLQQLDKQLAAAKDGAANAHRAAVAAIDAELPAAPDARAQVLKQRRAQLAPAARAPSKINLPSTEVDPLADADELDQQAAQIKKAEQELAHEASALDDQAKELAANAELQRQHQRSNELAMRDDDSPHLTAQHTTGDTTATAPTTGGTGAGSGAAPGDHTGTTNGGEQFGGGTTDRGPSTAVESEATIVLGDVIDHATIDGLARASRSGDPAQRADAARKTAAAVRARLDQLKRQRALVEQRAKQLRK